jgi:hypothetical protein
MMKMFSRHKDWDAPRATGDVASTDLQQAELLLAQLAQPALSQELLGEGAAVAAVAARIRIAAASGPTKPAAAGAPTRRAGRVLATAVCVFGATTGAAFAGLLPSPVQDVVHEALHKIGVTVPDSTGDTSTLIASQGNGETGTEDTGSSAARTPGTRLGSKGADMSEVTGGGNSGAGSASSGRPGKAGGKANHGANGKGKNAHGKATSGAHMNGGQAGAKTPHPPQGGGVAHGSGGEPKGNGGTGSQGGGKPPDAGGGKPADTGNGKGGGKKP